MFFFVYFFFLFFKLYHSIWKINQFKVTIYLYHLSSTFFFSDAPPQKTSLKSLSKPQLCKLLSSVVKLNHCKSLLLFILLDLCFSHISFLFVTTCDMGFSSARKNAWCQQSFFFLLKPFASASLKLTISKSGFYLVQFGSFCRWWYFIGNHSSSSRQPQRVKVWDWWLRFPDLKKGGVWIYSDLIKGFDFYYFEKKDDTLHIFSDLRKVLSLLT